MLDEARACRSNRRTTGTQASAGQHWSGSSGASASAAGAAPRWARHAGAEAVRGADAVRGVELARLDDDRVGRARLDGASGAARTRGPEVDRRTGSFGGRR